jgi:hypothetical protein
MLQKKPEWSGNGTMNGSKSNLNGSQEETTDYLFSKNQLRQVVREILAEMLGVDTERDQRKVYPTSKAFKLLGYDRAEQLRDAVASGLLRLGKEVEDRRQPDAKLPRYYFDIERCQKRLAELPQKRWTV